MNAPIPTIVLGGSGYVAGELLRLIAQHPQLELAAAVSTSQAEKPIRDVFPNLQACFAGQSFLPPEQLEQYLLGKLAVFSAAPHGASAGLVANTLELASRNGAEVTVVDASADFRYATAAAYEDVYGQAHEAPALLESFTCSVPEHLADTDSPHVAHPGCFATALLLAAVPLLKLELTEPELYAVGITGSTGSGRSPIATTHHPLRHANLYAYKPLDHRHVPEVVSICQSLIGSEPVLRFIPHSGPFARGIHVTIQARLTSTVSAEQIRDELRQFYAGHRFIHVSDAPPRLKDVVGSNYCHLGVAVKDDSVAVFSVIDNLVKGAAGGAMQWMNRKLNIDEYAGLEAPGPAWL